MKPAADKEDQDSVLSHQKCACSFMDEGGDLFHAVCSGVPAGYFQDQIIGEQKCQNARDRCQNKKYSHN